MCTYCNMGDRFSRWDPPYDRWYTQNPLIPSPAIPPNQINSWPIEKLKEYLDLLRQVKELEDKLGCPCEPNKADYIQLLEKRLIELKRK